MSYAQKLRLPEAQDCQPVARELPPNPSFSFIPSFLPSFLLSFFSLSLYLYLSFFFSRHFLFWSFYRAGSPYSWASAPLPDNLRVKLLHPDGDCLRPGARRDAQRDLSFSPFSLWRAAARSDVTSHPLDSPLPAERMLMILPPVTSSPSGSFHALSVFLSTPLSPPPLRDATCPLFTIYFALVPSSFSFARFGEID